MPLKIPTLSKSDNRRVYPEPSYPENDDAPEWADGGNDDFGDPRSSTYSARWKRWLTDLQLPAEGKLKYQIRRNRYYPFRERGPNIYELTIRYSNFYWAILGSIISVTILATWAGEQDFSNQFFILPFIAMTVGVAAIFDFKVRRRYFLNGNDLEYRFYHDKNLIVTGAFYNVYIRLKREVHGGSTHKYFHLVLNGFMIDSHRISETTRNLPELRKLGQEIAANLNINYFDEANASPHHVIRHCPKKNMPVHVTPETTARPVAPILRSSVVEKDGHAAMNV